MNRQLTVTDLAELERILAESGLAKDNWKRAKKEAEGLGLFVRWLVGLDREAAKAAMAGFMAGKNPNANQIEFINLVVEHLTEQGVLDAARLYDPPFTDVAPTGPDAMFNGFGSESLLESLDRVKQSAIAA